MIAASICPGFPGVEEPFLGFEVYGNVVIFRGGETEAVTEEEFRVIFYGPIVIKDLLIRQYVVFGDNFEALSVVISGNSRINLVS